MRTISFLSPLPFFFRQPELLGSALPPRLHPLACAAPLGFRSASADLGGGSFGQLPGSDGGRSARHFSALARGSKRTSEGGARPSAIALLRSLCGVRAPKRRRHDGGRAQAAAPPSLPGTAPPALLVDLGARGPLQADDEILPPGW